MKKVVFWSGVIIFVLGFLTFFLSGSTSGPTPESSTPTVPFLYGTNQIYWMLIALAGVVLIIVGAILKNRKE